MFSKLIDISIKLTMKKNISSTDVAFLTDKNLLKIYLLS